MTNGEIVIDTGFLGYLNYTTQLLVISFTTNQKHNQFHSKLLAHNSLNQPIELFTIYTYLRL